MKPSLVAVLEAANQTLLVDGNLDAVPEYFTPDYVAHLTERDLKGGHAAIRKVLEERRRAFPRLEVEVEVLLERGDRVAWQRTLRGVQEGALRGFPATGRSLVWRDMITSRFEGGLIAEDWVISDLAERLLLARKSAARD